MITAKKAHAYIIQKLKAQSKDTAVLDYIEFVLRERIVQEEVAKELDAFSIPTVLAIINGREPTYATLEKMKNNPNVFGGCFWSKVRDER